jgi:hypothetical protein
LRNRALSQIRSCFCFSSEEALARNRMQILEMRAAPGSVQQMGKQTVDVLVYCQGA